MNERQIVYLHGVPGGPEELYAFGSFPHAFFAPDRRNDLPHLDFPAYLEHLTNAICARFPDGPITLIGFSAGARMALELSVKLTPRAEHIILVSAAAPLQSGDFLRNMAGRLVFNAARWSPYMFGLLTQGQAWCARWAPRLLFRSVFASAQGGDAALKIDARFAETMGSAICASFRSGSGGYRREVPAYVAPWGPMLSHVVTPVTLWHGTLDNWTPLGMADALEAALPNVVAVHRLPGLSHYSALGAFLASWGAEPNKAEQVGRLQ